VEADVAGGGVRLLASLVNSTETSLPEKLRCSSPSISSGQNSLEDELLFLDQKKLKHMSNDRLYMTEPVQSDALRGRTVRSADALSTGTARDPSKKFSDNAVDPRRRIARADPTESVSRKSPLVNNIEPSPLQRISLQKESVSRSAGGGRVGSAYAEVDQLGPPSDDSAHGNTTEYDDEERGGNGSPSGRYNNYEEASDAYRSETFKSEITYSSYRDYPSSKLKSTPSRFAQNLAQDLGVDGQDATATISIIDQLSLLTDAEINAMDPELKVQILELRRQLGMTTKESRPVDAVKSVHNPISRSSSAEHRRGQSGIGTLALRSGGSGKERERSVSSTRSGLHGSSKISRDEYRDAYPKASTRTPSREPSSRARSTKISFQQDQAPPASAPSPSTLAESAASRFRGSKSPSTAARSAGTGKLSQHLQRSTTTLKYSQLDEMDAWGYN